MDNRNQLFRAFSLLGDLLSYRSAGKFSLVVCGGSALLGLELSPRATRDVDIVALLDEGNLRPANELPEPLVETARLVAQELNLPLDWLNGHPASILNPYLPNQGFPLGFQNRLLRQEFGESLSVYFVGRLDQIYFKLHAAADRDGLTIHFEDLRRLNPTDEELTAAAKWAMLHDPSKGFREVLHNLLVSMGKPDVLSNI